MAMITVLLLLLVSGALAEQLPIATYQDDSVFDIERESVFFIDPKQVKSHRNGREITYDSNSSLVADPIETKSDKASAWCEYPFEPVNGKCYLFSDIQLSFSEAETYCKILSSGHSHEITLAMSNFDFYEDEILLKAAAAKNKTFWIGGKTEDGLHWTWVDGQDVDLQMPFWYPSEPNTQGNNCMVTSVSTYRDSVRSYIHDNDCDESLNFICQTGNLICPLGFRRVGDKCYFLSEEMSLPHVHWQEARQYCLGLTVPVGYFADLAVLELSDHDGAQLMNNLAAGNSGTWIGLYEDINCDYWWVNGISQSLTTNFWYVDEPYCGNGQYHAWLNHISSSNRTYLSSTSPANLPFICQMHNTSTN